MREGYIDLRDDLLEQVEIHIPDHDAIEKGELSFKLGYLPQLKLSNFINLKKNKFKKIEVISHSGTKYQLLDCTAHPIGIIYPKIVVRSNHHEGKFKNIELSFQGLSDWLSSKKFPIYKEDSITKEFDKNKFKIIVKDPNFGSIKISNKQTISTDHEQNGIFKITERIVICIENIESKFNPDDLLSYIYRIRNLLSLIAGSPLNIEHCIDYSESQKNSFYFSNNESKDIPRQFFIKSKQLFDENKITYIIKNALEKKN